MIEYAISGSLSLSNSWSEASWIVASCARNVFVGGLIRGWKHYAQQSKFRQLHLADSSTMLHTAIVWHASRPRYFHCRCDIYCHLWSVVNQQVCVFLGDSNVVVYMVESFVIMRVSLCFWILHMLIHLQVTQWRIVELYLMDCSWKTIATNKRKHDK